MAVEYAGGGHTTAVNTASNTTTVSVPLYTGTAYGQPIVMAVASDASSGSWTTPSGWQVLAASSAILTDVVVAAYYKYSSGAESSSVTVTGPSGHMVGVSISLQGAWGTPGTATGSMSATVNQASGSTSATSPSSGGTLSPAPTTNSLSVRVYVCSSNNSAANMTLTGPASPWTQQQQFVNSTSTSAFCTGIGIYTQPNAVSTATASASAACAWRVIDAWFDDGIYWPISQSNIPRMRSFNY